MSEINGRNIDGWKIATMLSNLMSAILMGLSIWALQSIIDSKERLIRVEETRFTERDGYELRSAQRDLSNRFILFEKRLENIDKRIDYLILSEKQREQILNENKQKNR